MLSVIEHLVRHHPVSYYGYWERRQSDLAAFEERERRPVRRRHENDAEESEPPPRIGEVAATAALVVAFCVVLTGIARLATEPADREQQPMVAASASTATR